MGISRGVLVAATAALALAAAGCGEESSGSEGESGPERIVSLSPSATETLFAIGAGDQVVAVDEQSDHPRGVPRTDLSSYEPNVEAIADYDPDLVVLPETIPADVPAGLRRLGLTVFVERAPEDLADAYGRMRELGEATGHAEAGRELAAAVRGRVERRIAAAPAGPPLDVFHELDPDLYSASSDTFIGRIYERLGLRNVADRAARRSGSPYPQVSREAVVSADPELIVLADSECCGQTPAKAAARPGWADLAAVESGAVVAIDDDVASRWGPRIPLFVDRVVEAIESAREGSGR
jgi:iron complex transport system substrate-binding protein